MSVDVDGINYVDNIPGVWIIYLHVEVIAMKKDKKCADIYHLLIKL